METFRATGFKGGLNWYRAIDATFEEMSSFKGARIQQPSLILYGEKDAIQKCTKPWISDLAKNAPGLVRSVEIPGAGHWLWQEAPEEINSELIQFLSA